MLGQDNEDTCCCYHGPVRALAGANWRVPAGGRGGSDPFHGPWPSPCGRRHHRCGAGAGEPTGVAGGRGVVHRRVVERYICRCRHGGRWMYIWRWVHGYVPAYIFRSIKSCGIYILVSLSLATGAFGHRRLGRIPERAIYSRIMQLSLSLSLSLYLGPPHPNHPSPLPPGSGAPAPTWRAAPVSRQLASPAAPTPGPEPMDPSPRVPPTGQFLPGVWNLGDGPWW